jgi:hypothetical protein
MWPVPAAIININGIGAGSAAKFVIKRWPGETPVEFPESARIACPAI